METQLKIELLGRIVDTLADQYEAEDTDFEELHFRAFIEDYYIIGYYQAEQWLIKHDISPFEAIGDIIEWERETFGEVNLKAEDINSEKIVNLYAYIKGEELINELNLGLPRDELLEQLTEMIN